MFCLGRVSSDAVGGVRERDPFVFLISFPQLGQGGASRDGARLVVGEPG